MTLQHDASQRDMAKQLRPDSLTMHGISKTTMKAHYALYIGAFFEAIDWGVVARNLETQSPPNGMLEG